MDDANIPNVAQESVFDAIETLREGLRSGGFDDLEARFSDFWFLDRGGRVRLLAEAAAEFRRSAIPGAPGNPEAS